MDTTAAFPTRWMNRVGSTRRGDSVGDDLGSGASAGLSAVQHRDLPGRMAGSWLSPCAPGELGCVRHHSNATVPPWGSSNGCHRFASGPTRGPTTGEHGVRKRLSKTAYKLCYTRYVTVAKRLLYLRFGRTAARITASKDSGRSGRLPPGRRYWPWERPDPVDRSEASNDQQ